MVMNVKKVNEKSDICAECGDVASFFHSGCCHAHFEGVVKKDGIWIIVCEKCGKYVGKVTS